MACYAVVLLAGTARRSPAALASVRVAMVTGTALGVLIYLLGPLGFPLRLAGPWPVRLYDAARPASPAPRPPSPPESVRPSRRGSGTAGRCCRPRPGAGQVRCWPAARLPSSCSVLTAVIVVACLLAGRISGAILAAAAVPAAIGLTEDLIKPLVHRTYLDVLSYPAATVTVLLLASPQLARCTVLRVLIPAAAWVVVAVVAVGVMAVRFHYFTDTVAGAAVGTVSVCVLAFVLDLAQALFGRAFAAR
jgi:hypothetical protein